MQRVMHSPASPALCETQKHGSGSALSLIAKLCFGRLPSPAQLKRQKVQNVMSDLAQED